MAYGFLASQADPSLFFLHSQDVHLYLLIYVDDIVITASQLSVIDQLIRDLSHAFPVKDLGTLSYFLGVEVDHSSIGLFLSQRQYINDLLLKSNMLLAKPISTPMVASLKLSNFDATNFEDGTLYVIWLVGFNICHQQDYIFPLQSISSVSLCTFQKLFTRLMSKGCFSTLRVQLILVSFSRSSRGYKSTPIVMLIGVGAPMITDQPKASVCTLDHTLSLRAP